MRFNAMILKFHVEFSKPFQVTLSHSDLTQTVALQASCIKLYIMIWSKSEK